MSERLNLAVIDCITDHVPSASMTAVSRDYLMSIDAPGNDSKLIPVPNCSKGQPMQSMRVGNGGPTMRGRPEILGSDVVGDAE